MNIERLRAEACGRPVPVHDGLVEHLLAAHPRSAASAVSGREPTVAHVLAACAGYASADTATVALMMGRIGIGPSACVRITQVVDAMFIFSTAYLVQSACGRVVILCFRGTEPANLINWVGDADVGPEGITLGAECIDVHAGFYRNLRATRFAVIEELTHALAGRSLLDPSIGVEHPLEALYITGHSLGGAMAVLFALGVACNAEHRAIEQRLRAVYTFGQPMVAIEPLPRIAHVVGQTIFRHVLPRDVVPCLPPEGWGKFAHVGNEYVFTAGEWQRSETAVAQVKPVHEISRALLASMSTSKGKDSARFAAREHGSHHYIAALRPKGRVTEFGDYG
jgi:hypothetical protein